MADGTKSSRGSTDGERESGMTGRKHLRTLLGMELFAGLAENEAGILADLFPCRRFEASQVLFLVGDEGSDAYLVADGELQVLRSDCAGGAIGSPVLTTVKPGGVVGELALVDKQPRSADVVALVGTETVVVSRETLEQVVLDHPRIGQRVLFNLARVIAQRTRATTNRLATTLALVKQLATSTSVEDTAVPPVEKQSLDKTLDQLLEQYEKTQRMDNGYEMMQAALMGNLLARGYRPPLLHALELNIMGSLGGWVDFLLAERMAGRDRVNDFARHLRHAFMAHCEQHKIDTQTAVLLNLRMANAILGASTPDPEIAQP